jgi:hypothetical protein
MAGADEVTGAAQSGPPGMVRLTAGLGINWDAERDAFERWYLRTQCARNRVRVHRDEVTGMYFDKVVAIAWRAWRQAANRQAKAAASKVVVDA